MNLIERFRLTKQLHDQVEISGESVDAVLRSWSEKDYKSLCDYIMQCEGVVPKYVERLAALTGLESKTVVMEIIGVQYAGSGAMSGDNDSQDDQLSGVYLPEDTQEKDAFLKSLVQDQQRFM
ncbi:hypothetical protein [Desulfovibrio ferrophilus]|uniref:GE13195 n=1 Tax=Desulfovibrio ferrophilus TaxID=241368 RepID=A0A2Z6AZJ0_9BACT|nr:hypothetical protein [Desulfovibrio ferrophilus]BBD08687.1 GE13195 [Desulfovibrio ferrophilus]